MKLWPYELYSLYGSHYCIMFRLSYPGRAVLVIVNYTQSLFDYDNTEKLQFTDFMSVIQLRKALEK